MIFQILFNTAIGMCTVTLLTKFHVNSLSITDWVHS